MIALTHVPSPTLAEGQRTHVARVDIDLDLALAQHAAYCRMLRDGGAEVRTLDVNRDLSDGTFIEDTAIILDEVAVLASMGAEERRREPAGIEPELRKYREVLRVELPGTIEGGDVLRVGHTLLVGASCRTNRAGIRTLEVIVRRFGYRVVPVEVRGCLHLKTACTALPDGRLLVNPSWLDVPSLGGFDRLRVPEGEPWGANTLPLRDTVCLAAEHEQTAEVLQQRGYAVRTVALSELAKAEGGVTCLSLLLEAG